MTESLRARLLVAAPTMLDPNFHRAVIFVLEHSGEGALGVIVNRPSELPVRGTVDQWADLAATPPVVFVGGPVASSAIIAVAHARLDDIDDSWKPLVGSLGTVDLELAPELVPGVDRVRLFAGYAGWAPGQLEAELDENAWFVVDLRPDDPFSADPDELWWEILDRQGGELGRLRHYPRSASDN
jgi:putative transcriptional regulator